MKTTWGLVVVAVMVAGCAKAPVIYTTITPMPSTYPVRYSVDDPRHQANVGPLAFHVTRVWAANHVNPACISRSRRTTTGDLAEYLLVDLAVWNNTDVPATVPAPTMVDSEGRQYEQSQDGFLATDAINGYGRINPNQPLFVTAVFAMANHGRPDGLSIVIDGKKIPLD